MNRKVFWILRVRPRTVMPFLVILVIIICAGGHSLWAGPEVINAEYRVSNDVLSLGLCKQYAGAVCSVIYDGHEFVNDYDHGRQMQVAWFINGLDAEYNPTEAGSRDDDKKPTSTSKLLFIDIKGKTITTENHPAYWWRPGKGVNVQAVTKDTLKKTITLGYRGNPHVIVFDAAVTLSPELTGPPVNKIRISVPAFYTSKALTEHYQFDRHDGTMMKLYPVRPVKEGMIEIMRLNPERQRIPILSSPNGRHAVAAYTPQAENFWNYGSYNIPSNDPASACNKISVRFEHSVVAGQTYSYRTFVIVGNLETVKNAAEKLL